MKTPTILLLAFPMVALQEKEDLRPGLIAEYFDIGEELNDFPNIKGMTPALRRVERDVNIQQTNGNFNKSGLILHFCARWTGILQVPKAGKYTFYTESDDGSRLLLDNKLVVDNGGLHTPEEKSGEVELSAGPHEIRIDFFQNIGGASCRVKWASDDLKNEPIPAKAFFHKKDKDLDK